MRNVLRKCGASADSTGASLDFQHFGWALRGLLGADVTEWELRAVFRAYVAGDGPPIVFLDGIMSAVAPWPRTVEGDRVLLQTVQQKLQDMAARKHAAGTEGAQIRAARRQLQDEMRLIKVPDP